MGDRSRVGSGVVGLGDVYGMATSLLVSVQHAESKVPLEERIIRKEKRRLLSEERLRKSLILQSICPSCKGKLVRGKKNKKNDYKRDWKCSECDKTHSV